MISQRLLIISSTYSLAFIARRVTPCVVTVMPQQVQSPVFGHREPPGHNQPICKTHDDTSSWSSEAVHCSPAFAHWTPQTGGRCLFISGQNTSQPCGNDLVMFHVDSHNMWVSCYQINPFCLPSARRGSRKHDPCVGRKCYSRPQVMWCCVAALHDLVKQHTSIATNLALISPLPLFSSNLRQKMSFPLATRASLSILSSSTGGRTAFSLSPRYFSRSLAVQTLYRELRLCSMIL